MSYAIIAVPFPFVLYYTFNSLPKKLDKQISECGLLAFLQPYFNIL